MNSIIPYTVIMSKQKTKQSNLENLEKSYNDYINNIYNIFNDNKFFYELKKVKIDLDDIREK